MPSGAWTSHTSPENVSIGFWHLSPRGPRRVGRDIDAPHGRRSGKLRRLACVALEALNGARAESVNGRCCCCTAARHRQEHRVAALARQWRSWARSTVYSPRTALREPGYLMERALGEGGDDTPRWRLLLLEDCDELLAGGKANAGQACPGC